ncbi:unnamed protein product, partial [Brenthis ino]
MSNNAHELSNRLLNALDSNYNVVDMQTVNEIISILEKFNITKELLETTRLGKHVNELRRKTTDPTLARRAKVLVKRWRDLVIPAVASPAHTGSNRSSAERAVRRLGGTPLTSPALTRHVVSPAVPSPRPPSRPAWGGYESDSQDVILVDDEPSSPPLAHKPITPKPITPPVKRAPTPETLYDEKKAKYKKLKKNLKRGPSRAGSGTETIASVEGGTTIAHPALPAQAPLGGGGPGGGGLGAGVPVGSGAHAWGARNGSGARRNGWRRDATDPYAALVNRLPPAGAKKVKTTKELLEQIQLRGARSRPASPHSPGSPHSPDVMLIEPDPPITVDSPLRNGSSEPKQMKPEPEPEPKPEPVVLPPLEEEREWVECTCGEVQGEEDQGSEDCPAAVRGALLPLHVRALHNAFLPGINGTRAPVEPHRFAVRPPTRPDQPDLFSSVVPLYKYSDYADDYCVKNLSQIPICSHIPWTEFAPSPPPPPPPPSPPPLRPYPLPDPTEVADPPLDDLSADIKSDPDAKSIDSADDTMEEAPEAKVKVKVEYERPKVEAEMVSLPNLEPSERLKAPILSAEDVTQFGEPRACADVEKEFVAASPEHRTVERTKAEVDVDGGRALCELCAAALRRVPYSYADSASAPVVTLPRVCERDGACERDDAAAALRDALVAAAADTARDELGRPARPSHFAEWHECARLGDLVALPYVVLD